MPNSSAESAPSPQTPPAAGRGQGEGDPEMAAAANTAHTREPAQFAFSLFLVTGLLFVLFVLYGVAERFLLSDPNRPFAHGFHFVNGLIAVLATGALTAWLIRQASEPVLVPAAVEGAEFAVSEKESLERYARWFIQMRWIAVMVAVLLIIIAVEFARLLPRETRWPLLQTVAVLASSNALYVFLLRKRGGTVALLLTQVYADLLLLTILLHFSGGIENPLVFVLVFHVIIAGILVSRRQCYTVALVASLLIAVMGWAEWGRAVTHYPLVLLPHVPGRAAHDSLYVTSTIAFLTATLLLVAHFVTTLADRARADERLAREMAQRALAERQLLEQALVTTGAGLCVITPEGRYRWTSKRWEEWFQSVPLTPALSPKERGSGEGTPAEQAFQTGAVLVTEQAITASSSQPSPPGGEGGVRGGSPPREHEHRILQITTAPLRDSQGRIIEVVKFAQEVTQQKRVQAQLLQASKLAAVGELAGNVAHEVNNPIGIISAKGRLLLADHRQEISDKVAAEIAKITDAADRVAQIARKLLSLSRSSGVAHDSLDIRMPIRKALAMIEDRAHKENVSLQDQLAGDLQPVSANAGELEQVFLNLFLNALDAMPHGGRLQFTAFEEQRGLSIGGRCVTVQVSDTGTGMTKEVMERIFDPFFTTKEEGKGTGLGLSICLGIIRSHKGEIEVDSQPGEGTTFTIRLPVAQAVRLRPTGSTAGATPEESAHG
ncbi:MAG: ATP-binding protein [Planctomycetota bacterium]